MRLDALRSPLRKRLARLIGRVGARTLSVGESDVPRCFDNNYWYEGISWEPTVRYALIDLLHPGDVVFDCGANVGGLTTVMSRLVGPRGEVCAFEASPRIIDRLQHNLVLQGCSNVTLYHRAIYSDSTALLQLQFNPKYHHSDRIIAGERGDTQVLALALDDFVSEQGLVPGLVKMDIEGAEFAALRGFERTIEKHTPHLILETSVQDLACFDFLRARGYECWDLGNYACVRSRADFPEGSSLRNVVYVHTSRLHSTPYSSHMAKEEVAHLGEGNFETTGEAQMSSTWIDLSPGRYHFDMAFESDSRDDRVWCGVETPERVVLGYQTYSHFLATSYRDWVIHVRAPTKARAFFRSLSGPFDRTFKVNGARVLRLADLSRVRATVDFLL